MRWMLTRCCVLISLSVAISNSFQVKQYPRFYGVRTGRKVLFNCVWKSKRPGVAEWFKASKHDDPWEERQQIQKSDQRILFKDKDNIQNAFLIITDLQPDDSAVYFCKINGTAGPGTYLQAAKPMELANAQSRTNMKDGLIVLQGLMLAAFIAAVLMRKQKLVRIDCKQKTPQTSGLEIESCGGGLYEELSVYAQAEGAEAPWE
uniref:Ig-like domain-containing protein n=1 Tax=Salarias fasciatus TaxID=181472 RepID=A0A672H0C2_SALFA